MNIKNKIMIFCVSVLLGVMLFIISSHIITLLSNKGIISKNIEMVFSYKTNDEILREDVIKIDWSKEYPFTVENRDLNTNDTHSVYDKIEKQIKKVRNKIEEESKKVPKRYYVAELANRYNKFIGWDIVPQSEYASLRELEPGYYSGLSEKHDITSQAKAYVEFIKYCKELNISVFYVQALGKISKTQDSVTNKEDFSNYNADQFLNYISNCGGDYLDLRENAAALNINYHDLFYKTDHHWTAETGLWASRIIIDNLNKKYNCNLDEKILSSYNFKKDVYYSWFLGSQGKKVTLSNAAPDDFSLIYPVFKTRFHYQIPTKDIDCYGDFSIMYDMRQISKKDLYELSPYQTYNYSDLAITHIHNILNTNDKKILIIKDSFGNTVAPFISLCFEYTDVIDLRHFNGSLHSYIQINKPDYIIVIYNTFQYKDKIELNHHDLFDFR